MTKESWCMIKGYEGKYEISTIGRVRSWRGKESIILRQQHHYKGYRFVFLYKDNVALKKYVHRLVAIAFIPNPDMKPFVNHKDMNKENNILDNLEWMNESENTKHYWDNKEVEINSENIVF